MTRPASEAAASILARRSHSRFELRTKLLRRRYPADEVDAVLTRFQELGYLDDAAYAGSIAVRRLGTRGRSAIAAELSAKGIARLDVSQALESISDEAELRAATNLAARLASKGSIGSAEAIAARLQRKGFSNSVVRRACAAAASDMIVI